MKKYEDFYNKLNGENVSLGIIVDELRYNFELTNLFKNTYLLECNQLEDSDDETSNEFIDDVEAFILSGELADSLVNGEVLAVGNVEGIKKIFKHLSQLLYLVGDKSNLSAFELFSDFKFVESDDRNTNNYSELILRNIPKQNIVPSTVELVAMDACNEIPEKEQSKHIYLDVEMNALMTSILTKISELPASYILDEKLRNEVSNNGKPLTFARNEWFETNEIFQMIINHERYSIVYSNMAGFFIVHQTKNTMHVFDLLDDHVLSEVEKLAAEMNNLNLYHAVTPPFEYAYEVLKKLGLKFERNQETLHELKSLQKLFRTHISKDNVLIDNLFYQILTDEKKLNGVQYSEEQEGFVIEGLTKEGSPYELIIHATQTSGDDERYQFKMFNLEY